MIERPCIAEYLPHKDAMLLLDRLVDWDVQKHTLTAEVDIQQDSFFFEPSLGGIPAWVGFEYMAQSIAALSGLHGRLVHNTEPKIGCIMSVRSFTALIPAFPPGNTVQVKVHELFREQSVVSFDCVLVVEDREVCTAVINAIELDDPCAFFKETT